MEIEARDSSRQRKKLGQENFSWRPVFGVCVAHLVFVFNTTTTTKSPLIFIINHSTYSAVFICFKFENFFLPYCISLLGWPVLLFWRMHGAFAPLLSVNNHSLSISGEFLCSASVGICTEWNRTKPANTGYILHSHELNYVSPPPSSATKCFLSLLIGRREGQCQEILVRMCFSWNFSWSRSSAFKQQLCHWLYLVFELFATCDQPSLWGWYSCSRQSGLKKDA